MNAQTLIDRARAASVSVASYYEEIGPTDQPIAADVEYLANIGKVKGPEWKINIIDFVYNLTYEEHCIIAVVLWVLAIIGLCFVIRHILYPLIKEILFYFYRAFIFFIFFMGRRIIERIEQIIAIIKRN